MRLFVRSGGEVRVKGIAYPVATYEVVDLKANVDAHDRTVLLKLLPVRLPRTPASRLDRHWQGQGQQVGSLRFRCADEEYGDMLQAGARD
jgi:hypothetical protein